jgi:hypothetical protein
MSAAEPAAATAAPVVEVEAILGDGDAITSSLAKFTPIGPWHIRGKVVPGFKRGSRLLGTPTANMDPEVYGAFLDDAVNGVYAGWAQVGPPGEQMVYPSVLCIGYNPQFQNEEKTLEVYIMHEFEEDFYGETLGIICCCWLRAQCSYPSLDDLKEAIANDVKDGAAALKRPQFHSFVTNQFFSKNPQASMSKPAGEAKKEEDTEDI